MEKEGRPRVLHPMGVPFLRISREFAHSNYFECQILRRMILIVVKKKRKKIF